MRDWLSLKMVRKSSLDEYSMMLGIFVRLL